MPCRISFGWAREGNTVPYPSFEKRDGHSRRRHNRGFSDLRGRPEIAAAVAEVADSPEFAAWLVELAGRESPLFSLGCDLGTFRRSKRGVVNRYASGGYIQLVGTNYRSLSEDYYKRLAESLGAHVEQSADDEQWDAGFLLQIVQLNLDGFNDETISLSVHFNAWGADPTAAKTSCELLIRTLRLGIATDVAFGSGHPRAATGGAVPSPRSSNQPDYPMGCKRTHCAPSSGGPNGSLGST